QAHTNIQEYLPNVVTGSASILTKLGINNRLKLSSIELTGISSMSDAENIVIEHTKVGLVKGRKISDKCYLWTYYSS
ncbi:17281_t:CDS:2, partial [Racocetra persica]